MYLKLLILLIIDFKRYLAIYYKNHDIKMSTEFLRPLKFKTKGVINYGGYKWTYCNETVMPDAWGARAPGTHTEDNVVKDGNGNVLLASIMHPKVTPLVTPILDPNGVQYTGVVYDYYPTNGYIEVFVNFWKIV